MLCWMQACHVMLDAGLPCYVGCRLAMLCWMQACHVMLDAGLPCYVGCRLAMLCWMQACHVMLDAGLPCYVGCRLAKGAIPSPESLKDIYFNGLLLCSLPQFLIRDPV
ncbi:WD repeat and FYVE domain-containing protein 2-like X2 [Biomphalaria glabrata]|nr:Biomphalaria glabrata WD repeat and FYVE domain-containing protein 2-like; transcript variant X2 [Biomphalaria glabrata]